MLPSHMAEPSERREPNKVALTPRHSPAQKIQTMPVLAEWLQNPPAKQTLFIRRSPIDRQLYDVVVDMSYAKFVKAYSKWIGGEHIQVAFSTVPADVREFMMSGVTPAQWDEMFKEAGETDA